IKTWKFRQERDDHGSYDVGDPPLRFGTSVGAHFREAQQAKSHPDFMEKMVGSIPKIEETIYCVGTREGGKILGRDELKPLTSEANQLMAIFVTIVRKTKAGVAKRKF